MTNKVHFAISEKQVKLIRFFRKTRSQTNLWDPGEETLEHRHTKKHTEKQEDNKQPFPLSLSLSLSLSAR